MKSETFTAEFDLSDKTFSVKIRNLTLEETIMFAKFLAKIV